MRALPSPKFNARRFLKEEFGSATEVVRLVQGYGITPPDVSAVTKWSMRGRVSATWLPVLLIVLHLEKGAPVKLTDYLDGWGAKT